MVPKRNVNVDCVEGTNIIHMTWGMVQPLGGMAHGGVINMNDSVKTDEEKEILEALYYDILNVEIDLKEFFMKQFEGYHYIGDGWFEKDPFIPLIFKD